MSAKWDTPRPRQSLVYREPKLVNLHPVKEKKLLEAAQKLMNFLVIKIRTDRITPAY